MNKFSMVLSLAVVTFGAAAAATPAMACGGGCGQVSDYIDASDIIYGGESHNYSVYASSGETMYVELTGYNRSDIDVIVTDERGRIVGEGTSGNSWEEFDFVARRDGVYYVEVINIESEGCVEYDLSVY